MPTHVENLRNLDELYQTAPAAAYEKALKEAVEGLSITLPDFTIAYAEIWTIGPERHYEGRMAHVFVPRKDAGKS